MEFHYTVTIKGSNEEIKFETNKDQNANDPITGVKFMFNSDDATKQRDRNGRIEIVINGKFNDREDTFNEIRKLSDWAKSNKDVYREVTIEMETFDNIPGKNFKRTYSFDQMFCIDYSETSGSINNEKEGIEFEIFMAQAPTGSNEKSITKAEIV